uniref:Arrestin domain-containing protein 3-like n=1 Tax=Phallusia mammillata TaxID=59560 RepID=A0A6F9D6B1_9ASCI|nr:arrestin domain-containing protein 3-like [Phallusia mammillata]
MVNLSIEVIGGKVVFQGGDVISGNVIVDCKQPVDFKKLEITYKGSAKTMWSEGSGDNRTTYVGKEPIFNQTETLLKSTGQKISPGRNLYPFQFQLPLELPSSFESPVELGYIRYRLQARLQQTLKSKRSQLMFTVLEEVDLNKFPLAGEPAISQSSKTLCCWCCTSGLIELEVRANKTGFVPGEFVTVSASIKNGSSSKLRNCKLSIVQLITLSSGYKSKLIRINLTKGAGVAKDCKKRSTITFDPQKIQLPAVVPSHERLCRIIDVDYCVELICHTPLFSEKIRTWALLEVGTIPLNQGSNDETQGEGSTNMPASDFSVPAPTYAAATAVTIPKSEENPEAVTFAPQYNYYDWSQTAFTYK